MRSSRLTRALLVLIVAAAPARAAEFFAAPDGRPDGDGSKGRPWDLATALAQPAAVKPGDTVWLRGGTYRGAFTSRLKGAQDRPVVVRQAPGERATVELWSKDRDPLFVVDGEWVTFWGFEVTCPDPVRTTKTGGPYTPPDIRRGSIHCRAAHARFVNLIVHDLGVGVGFWSEGEGGEIYGCLVYHNGWRGPDRGHGHAIYAQNRRGTKRLVDNVLFNQFSHGIHVYGSSRAPVSGFHLEGNVAFNNGVLAGGDERAPNILVGGGSPAERVMLVGNYTYHAVPATGVRLGYGAVNEDLACRDNYFVGFNHFRLWKRLAVKGNTFAGRNSLVTLDVPPDVRWTDYDWDGNTYLSAEQKYLPLNVVQGKEALANGWKEWQGRRGLDKHGRYVEGPLDGVKVFVRPNRYEPGRGHVVVYNWDRKDEVEVDLKGVLAAGQGYRVVRAQDYFGRSVAEGRYDGKAVRLPMRPAEAVRPVGMEKAELPVTGPEFEVFVVLPVHAKP